MDTSLDVLRSVPGSPDSNQKSSGLLCSTAGAAVGSVERLPVGVGTLHGGLVPSLVNGCLDRAGVRAHFAHCVFSYVDLKTTRPLFSGSSKSTRELTVGT